MGSFFGQCQAVKKKIPKITSFKWEHLCIYKYTLDRFLHRDKIGFQELFISPLVRLGMFSLTLFHLVFVTWHQYVMLTSVGEAEETDIWVMGTYNWKGYCRSRPVVCDCRPLYKWSSSILNNLGQSSQSHLTPGPNPDLEAVVLARPGTARKTAEGWARLCQHSPSISLDP